MTRTVQFSRKNMEIYSSPNLVLWLTHLFYFHISVFLLFICSRKKEFNQMKVPNSNVVEFLFCILQELNINVTVCVYKKPKESTK